MRSKIDGLFSYVIVQFELIMDYFLDLDVRIEDIEVEIEELGCKIKDLALKVPDTRTKNIREMCAPDERSLDQLKAELGKLQDLSKQATDAGDAVGAIWYGNRCSMLNDKIEHLSTWGKVCV